MSGKPLPWLKLNHDYLDNPKLGALPEQIQLRYIKLYMLAHHCQADGVITLSQEEIAWKLHISLADLNETTDLLTRAKLYRVNGRGPEIPAYLEEQITQAQREEERVKKQGQRANKPMSPACPPHVPPRESESESESESDKDLESEQERDQVAVSQSSQSYLPNPGKRDSVDPLLPINKLDIFNLLKIPPMYRGILDDHEITATDLIAGLAYTTSSTRFRKPVLCMAMNLARHEYPERDHYSPRNWNKLPQELLEKIGDLESLQGRCYASGEYAEWIEH